VLLSKCIEFDHCRYDGSMISSDFVKKIKPFVDFQLVCPEVEIGLGIPRKSLRLIRKDKKKRLVQPATDKDVTSEMMNFAESFLSKRLRIHGAILKSRSPSCGIKDVKLYGASKNAAPIKRTAGLFGEVMLHSLPCVVESEGRLRNKFIQEHFLASIFTFARFERVKKKSSIAQLVLFHAENKFLFMAYNQELLRNMGRIAANQGDQSIETVLKEYETYLYAVFKKPPSHSSTINVLLHIFGFVSDNLSKSEKSFFMKLVDKYKHEKIPLTVLSNVLKSWVVRFGEPYLATQTFFNPFPEDLLEEDLSMIADQQRYWE
ncbi:MAG: DUF1722 domain-containing protein, partial [Candidatus Thermoplasmatota archaeon]|nr:DUF1722 domain-containing protein [Candidatus Thermoplasmatota archaeon]